jgi:hypothetical protein
VAISIRVRAGCFYDLLFATASATLLEVAANPKRLGAEIGVIAIPHTWGQNLLLHRIYIALFRPAA